MTILSNHNYNNASAWRERSIVKRSTSAVDDMVETMTKTSGFLKRHDNPISKIPQLTRDQVEVGTLLGYGTFSFVHEVQAFDIDADENDAAQKREEETRPSLEEQQNVQDLIARGEHGELAIKHLRQDLMESTLKFEEAAADLIVEAKYLAALDHPNIIKLRAVAKGGASAFESGQHDSFFLVIDKLHRTFKEKILEWQFLDDDSSMLMLSSNHCDATSISHDRELLLEKIDLGHQIAKALAYLHEHRLVYRDLKPQNCGIKGDNTAQLFDFGFCRELPDDENSSYGQELDTNEPLDENKLYCMSGKGSLMYLAPEVLRCGRYNQKADVYSFAMVFYELLTLNKPFPSMASAEAHRDLVGKRGARPPLEHTNIPKPIQRLLRDAWDDNIISRLTMRQVCQRLEQLPAELEREAAAAEAKLSQHPPQATGIFCGSFWDAIFGFVSDVQCGYKVLTKATPFPGGKLGLQDDSSNSLLVDSVRQETPARINYMAGEYHDLMGNETEETMNSSDSYFSSRASWHLNPVLADEESKEVVFCEEARTAVLEFQEAEFAREDHEEIETYEEQRVDGDHEPSGDMELRCPASPLARTTSAPQPQRRTSLTFGKEQATGPYHAWPASVEVPV